MLPLASKALPAMLLAAAPPVSPPAPDSGSVSPHAARSRADHVPPADLGTLRYRDPVAGERWIAAEVAGAAVPRALGLFDRNVWTVGGTLAWTAGLTPRWSLGGRHGLGWYGAGNLRNRLHEHEIQTGFGLLPRGSNTSDRLGVAFGTHRILRTVVDGKQFRIGGLEDTMVKIDYGMEHGLWRRLHLGWRVGGGFTWVFSTTQRQATVALRALWDLRGYHWLSAELRGFGIHRDANQFGEDLPRFSPVGQFHGQWAWMHPQGVGLYLFGRVTSAFRSGEAPVFEVREEALRSVYGDIGLGVRVHL